MSLNELQAHFYLCEAESIPEPVLNSNGSLNIEADNLALEAWSNTPSTFSWTRGQCSAFSDGVQNLLSDLKRLEDSDETEIQTLFYDHAKLTFGKEKDDIRTFFAMLYLLLFDRNHGPRWGQFVKLSGVDNFIETTQARLAKPLR